MTKHLKVGIIAAPERSADIISCLIDRLPEKFSTTIDNKIEWEVASVVDTLTGAAETAHDILYNAASIKQLKEWDFAICLTDLPIFHNNKIVAADISFTYQVAQISLPSYGWPPMQTRISRTITRLISEMYAYNQIKQAQSVEKQSRINTRHKRVKQLNKLSFRQRFPVMFIHRQNNPYIHKDKNTESSYNEEKDEHHHSDTDNEPNSARIDVRFLIYPKVIGLLRIIIGMTFANNPFKIMSSFKSVIAIAFTTGAFALIFPTIWVWGQAFSPTRLSFMMIAAILGLVVWLIAVHHLWEGPSSRNKALIRRLYNLTTFSTLIIDVAAYYVVLYVLFFIASAIFIPPDYLETVIPKSNDPTFISYMRVAWIEASIATIVSAMGAGLEDDQKIRNMAYGYRQNFRYKEMTSRQSHSQS